MIRQDSKQRMQLIIVATCYTIECIQHWSMHYFNEQYIKYNPLSTTKGDYVYPYPKHKILLPIDLGCKKRLLYL